MKEPVKNVSDLQEGDVIVNKGSGNIYIVVQKLPDGNVIASASVHVTHANEWDKFIE